MNDITFNNGSTIDFGADNIASTSTVNNATGILSSGATVAGADWATNSGNLEGGTNNFITTYTGYTDVARLGTPDAGIRIIGDGSTTNVRLIEGSGDSGTVTLSAATTAINTLNQSISGGSGSASIDLPAQIFRTNAILMGPNSRSLTIGAVGGSAATSGTLTNQTGAGGSLIFTNNSTSDMTINSVIAENSNHEHLLQGWHRHPRLVRGQHISMFLSLFRTASSRQARILLPTQSDRLVEPTLPHRSSLPTNRPQDWILMVSMSL